MRRLIWLFGWTGVAVWSFVSAIAYWLLDRVGALIARNADSFSADPETVVRVAGFFSALRHVSTSAVLVVWGLVSLLILAVPWLFDRATAAVPKPSSPFVPSADGRFANNQEGVIDLSPGEYTVRDPSRPAGSAPWTDSRRR